MQKEPVRDEPAPEEIVRSVDLPASPEEVWVALTDDSLLGDWLGGDVEIDARPGGSIRFHDGDEVRRGAIDTFIERRRLSFIWYVNEEEPTEVVFEIEPGERGTILTVTERPFIWEFDAADPAWIGGPNDTWLVAGVR